MSKKAIGVDINRHPNRPRNPDFGQPISNNRLNSDTFFGLEQEPEAKPSAQQRQRRRRRAQDPHLLVVRRGTAQGCGGLTRRVFRPA